MGLFKVKEPKEVREKVEFISSDEMKFLASRLNAKDYEAINNIIDRYVDFEMQQHIKAKINEEKVDENFEIKMRGVLEFKQFLKNLQ